VSFLPQVSSIGERPIAFRVLVGFGITLRPLFCCLMGWRGPNQQKMGSADIGAYMWFGGLTVILSALMGFVMGNTFSFVLFMGYGTTCKYQDQTHHLYSNFQRGSKKFQFRLGEMYSLLSKFIERLTTNVESDQNPFVFGKCNKR